MIIIIIYLNIHLCTKSIFSLIQYISCRFFFSVSALPLLWIITKNDQDFVSTLQINTQLLMMTARIRPRNRN